jgi:hypothetical protein
MTPIPPNAEGVNRPYEENLQLTQSFLGTEQSTTPLQKLTMKCKACLLAHLNENGDERLSNVSLDKECRAAILIKKGEQLIGTYCGLLTKSNLTAFRQEAIEKMQNTLAAQLSISEITISTLILENPEQLQGNMHHFNSTITLPSAVSVNGIEKQITKGELVKFLPTYYGAHQESHLLGVPVSQFFLGVSVK